MRKVKEEKLKVCPECNTNLGAAPLQKIRPDHQVQGIRDTVSSKRRELIERGLIKKLKKGEPKKLALEDIDLNKILDMLIDTPPSLAPSPTPVFVATSSRRKEKSISSIVNATPLVDDDQVSNQQNISSSSIVRGRDRGRGRGRGSSENNANVDRFQDPSRLNNVVDLNKEDTHPGSLTSPLLSVKATQHNQQVESIAYDAESSKNDNISKKNKSIEPLDGMNDLSKAREQVPKFINRTQLINLDDYEVEDDDDDDDDEYVPSPKVKEHKVHKRNVKRLDVIQAIEEPSRSNNNNIDKGKGKKGRRGRKKKETNIPPPPPLISGGGDGGSGGINTNVAQVQDTTETAGGSSNGSTRVVNERVHPIWFTLVACEKQEGPSPLPPISTRYIKIQDVNKPSSYIMKYLAHKLSPQSEDEVELHMLGMLIRPDLPIKNLEKLWLRVAPHFGKSSAKVGDFTEEFVMVLKYSRSHTKLN